MPSPHQPPPAPLHTDDLRVHGAQVIEWIAHYLETVEERPVRSRVEPGDVAAMLPLAAPEEAEDFAAILSDLDRIVTPGVTHWQSPNFFGYFPANASVPAILGELVSAGLGVQGMLWSTSPACTEIETRMLDWLGSAIGLPVSFLSHSENGGGVIQGTASEAVMIAMVAARYRAKQRAMEQGMTLRDIRDSLVAYTSNQAHSSLAKAANIIGLEQDQLRLIEVDGDHAMKPDALEAAIQEDLTDGRLPFFICATVGTTSSTAIDPVEQIGAIAAAHNAWLHIDAAYVGAMLVCPEHRWMIEGVEQATSFNFNPHKWLLTNFDCSALWTTDRSSLIDSLSVTPEYLRNQASDTGAVIDYRDWQAPLGRRFRALKLWFVMRRFGLAGLRAHIREHLRLAEMFENWVQDDDRFELSAKRTAGLICFRAKGTDELNRTLLDRVNDSGELFMTHTSLPHDGADHFILRFAIGAAMTREEHVRKAWDTLCCTLKKQHA